MFYKDQVNPFQYMLCYHCMYVRKQFYIDKLYFLQKPLDQSENGQVTVRIERASRSDAGQYLCYGFPSDRSTYLAKTINVIVGGSGGEPTRNDEDRNTVFRGNPDETVELTCRFTNDDPYDLKWRKLNSVSNFLKFWTF